MIFWNALLKFWLRNNLTKRSLNYYAYFNPLNCSQRIIRSVCHYYSQIEVPQLSDSELYQYPGHLAQASSGFGVSVTFVSELASFISTLPTKVMEARRNLATQNQSRIKSTFFRNSPLSFWSIIVSRVWWGLVMIRLGHFK